MMYIGTSLGRCVKSILAGEVSLDDVLFIVTRTDCPDISKLLAVLEGYYNQGNPYSRNASGYELTEYSLESVQDLGAKLWMQGKIHQPRTYGADTGYVHPDLGENIWIEVLPPRKMNIPVIKNTWEQLKMLVSLTQ